MIKSRLLALLALLLLTFTNSIAQVQAVGEMAVNLELLNTSSEIHDGVAKVVVDGGLAPFQYKWSNVNTPLQAAESVGLIEGTEHSVIISDASGNTVSKKFSIAAKSITEIFQQQSIAGGRCAGSRSILGCFCDPRNI